MTSLRRFQLPVLLLLAASPLMAQVGHPPGDSPFREIRTGTTVEAFAGSIFGSGGGAIPAGPRDGPIAGVRLLLRAKSTISLGFAAWGARTVRTPIDPDATLANRFGAELDQSLYGGELTVQFNLTGGKSWHGVAPFAGVGIGIVKGEAFEDPAGYEFGTKFYFAPNLGSRIFVSRRAYLRLEARGFAWKIAYPPSYAEEPAEEPGTQENPNAVNPTGRRSQYVLAPTLMAGIGFDF